jgi:predicted ATPase/class 3 adenylate cyclase
MQGLEPAASDGEASTRVLPTGTVTFTVTDIEGSTRLLLALGPRFVDVIDAHHAIVREIVDGHGGTVVSTSGDGVFAVFPTANGAVAAVLGIQRALRDHDWPEGREVRVRMGVHTGQGVLGGDDYIGMDVHRAARIGAVASGGQVLLSADTAEAVTGSLPSGVALVDLGERLLKDLPAPERIFQLVADDLPAHFAALASLRRPVTPPPRVVSSFVPRPEVDQAVALLATTRLLTLTGPGGTGKTRLALAVADRVAAHYPDGVAFADLAPIATPDLVVPAIAAAVGLPPGEGPVRPRLVEHLREAALLLVLDNLEQVIDAASVVAELVASTDAVRVLATSRAPLRVAGEHELPLPPLALPTADDETDVPALGTTPAVSLFVDRAAAVRPGFTLTPQNARDVAEVVRRLDGLPLAVELAAARVRLLPPAEIAAALRTRGLRSLGQGRRDAPERQRTLEAVVDWSYRLLGTQAAATFRAMSLFAGGATVAQLANVAGVSDVDVLEALDSLVQHSLVGQDTMVSQARFTMLETIRAYARQRLEQSGEAGAAARRHALVFLGLAQAARPHLDGWAQARWMDDLDCERDNLRAALAWGVEHDAEVGMELGLALSRYWQVRGNRREGAYWLSRVVAAAETAPDVLDADVGDVRRKLATLLDLAGEWQEASDVLAAELVRQRQTGDVARLAATLNSYAVTRRNCGDPRGARLALDEAVGLRREAGDEAGLASSLTNLAVLAMDDEDPLRAEQLLHEVLSLDERLGNTDGLALDHANLGWVHLQSGDVASAALELDRALAGFTAVQDDAGTAYVLEGCAVLAAHAGDPVGCAMLIGASQRLRDRADEPMPHADRQSLMRLVAGAHTTLGGAWEQEIARGGREPGVAVTAVAQRALDAAR